MTEQTGALMTEQTKDEAEIKNSIGLYFDIVQEHSVSIQNAITDNYMENNTAIHDHIGHSPIVVNLRGLSGELVYVPNDAQAEKLLNETRIRNNTLNTIGKLGVIPALLPPVDNMTQIARNRIEYMNASINRYVGIVTSLFNNDDSQFVPSSPVNQVKLKTIFEELLVARNSNTAFKVETPYKTFENMYIQSITMRQGNENYITDIDVTLKQLQFADTLTTEADKKVLEQCNALMRAREVNHGVTQGVMVDEATKESMVRGWVNKANPNLKGKGKHYTPKK